MDLSPPRVTRGELNYSNLARHSRWLNIGSASTEVFPLDWQPWLLLSGSLTSALIEFSNGDFRVNVLSEKWVKPHTREAIKLGSPPHLAAMVREVELLCEGHAVVYARSIIPLALFESEPHTFMGLGSKPLGHLLFKDGRARNRQRMLSAYHQADKGPIYGRVTPYEYHGGEILVSEFFISSTLLGHDKSKPS